MLSGDSRDRTSKTSRVKQRTNSWPPCGSQICAMQSGESRFRAVSFMWSVELAVAAFTELARPPLRRNELRWAKYSNLLARRSYTVIFAK